MGAVQVWKCKPGWGEPLESTSEWIGKSTNEIVSTLPGGVYTTLRTYGRVRTLKLNEHFARLVESAGILGCRLDVDIFRLREKLRVAINHSTFSELRIRIHIPFNTLDPTAFLICEELILPTPADYSNGVQVTTRLMHREHAEAKSSGFISSAEKIRKGQSACINEVIMSSEYGIYLEGLSSNFFIVEKGSIWTAQKGVLAGITRDIILNIIREKQIPIVLAGFPVARTAQADEVFITSTSRGVLPVVSIDEKTIGVGNPGPLTITIRNLYEEKIARLLEII